MSNSLWPHGLQHARLPCPSPTSQACSNSCPSSQWSNHLILCHPLLLLPSIFPSIRMFSNGSVLCIRWPKYWSFSISPSNEYLGLIYWYWLVWSPCLSKRLTKVFSNTTIWKYQFFGSLPSSWSSSHIRTWPLEKPLLWLYRSLSAKWCLCFLICRLGLS